ncbi:MAG: hypothetical protein LLG14_10420 [Nocardiaceae bacterium]|nr:hypothetical protein [Nocardiaceae bacterium]
MKLRAFLVVAGLLVLAGCGTTTITGSGVAPKSGLHKPSITVTTRSADAGLGTRDHPVPIGIAHAVGDEWNVTVVSIDPDAWDVISAENEFNDPPAAGRQFVMARIRAEYVGKKSGEAWVDLSDSYLGSNRVTFGNSMDDYCGVIPDSLTDKGEQFPNSTVEGNVCWSVPIDSTVGGSVLIEFGFSDDDRVFFDGVK